MEDMKTKVSPANMAYYINLRTIESVHQALNIPVPRGISGGAGGDKMNGVRASQEEEDGEEVDEDVAEVYDDWRHINMAEVYDDGYHQTNR